LFQQLKEKDNLNAKNEELTIKGLVKILNFEVYSVGLSLEIESDHMTKNDASFFNDYLNYS
jgi:hypothetical protein